MTDLSGILNINKPSGVTSFWAVKQVRRLLGVKKAGHCGTLDPLADGVLVVLFGKATKLQSTLMAGKKTYRARIKLGVTSDTADITGKLTECRPPEGIDEAGIIKALDGFRGEISQVPPMYSALKYGGKKLYEYARKGIEVKRESRKVTIYKIDLLRFGDGTLDIRIECSPGTYIRTLAQDLGEKLGCGALIETLCRERSGDFTLETALDGRKLQTISREELLKYNIIEGASSEGTEAISSK